VDDTRDTGGYPLCQRCRQGALVPLSDYDREGASLRYKAWVCTFPGCEFNLKIRRGEIILDEPVAGGATRERSRD
jgi:hypothetical protein